MEESKLFIEGVGRAFFGREDGGCGKAPLEDQRHSPLRPEGNKIQRSGRENKARTEHETQKKLLENLPPQRNPPLNLSEIQLFISEPGWGSSILSGRYQTDPAEREREQWWPGRAY